MKKRLMFTIIPVLLSGCNQTPVPSNSVEMASSAPTPTQKTGKPVGPFGFEMGLKHEQMKTLKLFDLGKDNQWATDAAPGDKGAFKFFTLTITKNTGLCEVDASAGDPSDPRPIFDELAQRLVDKYGAIKTKKSGELPAQKGYRPGDYVNEYTWEPSKPSDVARVVLSSFAIKGDTQLTIKYTFKNYNNCMKEIASGAQL